MRAGRPWLLLCMVALLLFGDVAAGTPCAAQDDQVVNVFLPAPRALRRLLSKAYQARDEQRYGDAVDALGQLLSSSELEVNGSEDATAQDYFIGPAGMEGTQTSLKAEAQRLLGSMPSQARKMYELRFGHKALALLKEALASSDAGKLTEVTRQYFHTRAGYEATMLLGRHHLDYGRPLAAALCFKRIADTPSARGMYDPELSVMLATCWYLANMPDKAASTLVDLHSRIPDARIEVGDGQLGLFRDPGEALTWLQRLVGSHTVRVSTEATQWTMFRGNATRNARTSGSMPLLSHRWRVPTANDPFDERIVAQTNKQYVDMGFPALPSLHPLAVNDVILMRTPRRLVAVDFPTGKRIWEFPWDKSPDEKALQSLRREARRGANSLRNTELSQRLWLDAPYGQLASDGKSVFMLTDLSYAITAGTSHFVVPPGIRQANPGWPKTNNQLVALSLRRQGALQWVVGGEDGVDEPKLAGAFFLGVPLPILGQLYALVEVNGEIRLVVLDARNGQLQWQQKVAHLDTRTITRDNLRRLAGATPSFADGVLLCPTSAGALVALDVSSRSLLWGYQYTTQVPLKNPQFGWQPTPQQADPSKERWADATATIADGAVLITPVESEELHCLDLLTGKLRWKPLKRDDLRYLACVYDGNVVLVGRQRVTAVSLADGTEAWSEPISLGTAMPSGRGFFSDRFYYLPTTQAELLKIDLSSGTLAARVPTGTVLGNLICYRDEVISHGVDWLTAYYQSEPLRQRVAKRLGQDPNDAWALARQSELLLQDGNRVEALVSLRRAHRADPENDAIRALLVRSLLDGLADDFTGFRQYLDELDGLVDQPDQRAEYLRLVALGLEQSGENDRAFDTLLELAETDSVAQGSLRVDRSVMEQVDKDLTVRRDRWIQSRVASLLSKATPDQLQRMNNSIAARFEATAAIDTAMAYRQFIGYFGAHPLADQARLRLATQLIDSDELLEAELLLGQLVDGSDDVLAAGSTAQLARLLSQAGRLDQAAGYYRQLRDRWGRVICDHGRTGGDLYEQALGDPQLKEALDTPHAWPYGRAEVSPGQNVVNRYPSYQRVYPIALTHRQGPIPEGIRLVLDQRRNAVIVRDGLGREMQVISLNDGYGRRFYSSSYSITHAKANGHLLFLSIGYDLLAVDALRAAENPSDAIVWRADLTRTIPGRERTVQQVRTEKISDPWGQTHYVAADASKNRIGMSGPLHAFGICYQKLREVICADPLSGETIWARGNIEPGSDLFGDRQLLFVVAPGSSKAMVLSAADGHLLGYRDIDPSQARWTTYGRCVLAWKQQGTTTRLRYYDAWSGEEIWTGDFAAGAKGTLIEGDELAVMQADGRFTIFSLREGVPQLDTQLAEFADLADIHVLRTSNQYFLAASGPRRIRAGRSVAPAPTHAPLIDGLLYAFDRSSGKPLWQVPAAISNYGFPLEQPPQLPVLTLMSNKTQSRARGTRGTVTDLLCIDKRDGRAVLAEPEVVGQTHTYEISGDPKNHRVQVRLSSRSFTITFSDEPIPPEPPAQTGEASSHLGLKSRRTLGEVTGALIRALGQATPPSETSHHQTDRGKQSVLKTKLDP